MNRAACLLATALAVLAHSSTLCAQTAATSSRGGATPAPPGPLTPVGFLRQLLLLPAAEREPLLTAKPVSEREVWRNLLEKYQAVPEREREDRLRATELYFLMKKSPAERPPYFARVPAADLTFFQERLKKWDELDESMRQEPLVIEHFLQIENARPRDPSPSPMADDLRNAFAKMQADFSSIPEPQRQKMSHGFQQFLDLPADQKEKTLSRFSPEERQRIEATLKAFERLSPPQQTNAVAAIEKLMGMEGKDREDFLQTAAVWKTMSAEDRNTWSLLMRVIPGGLPPLPGSLPPLPSIPSTLPGQSQSGNPPTPPGAPTGSSPQSLPKPPGSN